ncbi:hypothetical protein FRC19_000330 [Serendipita sp. 401]|nr:hypothetical protein FRC19_000330 [Serendipita sp. 401]
MTFNLDTLPDPLVFEVCNWLDIYSLCALSEVNRALRHLSTTQPSFWIYTLSHCGIMLPLMMTSPLHAYPAVDLHLAAHRAIMIEANFGSTHPRLRSWNTITWPYEPSPGVRVEDIEWEEPIHAIYMHCLHPNGEWLLLVSTHNIVRFVHLRTGKVAAVWDKDQYVDNNDKSVMAWGLDFTDENDSIMAMNCRVDGIPAIRILEIHLDPASSLATVKSLGTHITGEVASDVTITQRYVITVIPIKGTEPNELGRIHMFNWKTHESIEMPNLYPSMSTCAAEGYMISLGLGPGNGVYAQIIGYPMDEQEESDLKHKHNSQLPVLTYQLSLIGPEWDDRTFGSSQIGHSYTGERFNFVHVWMRPKHSGSRYIFSFSFDLLELKLLHRRGYQGTPGISIVECVEESHRVLEESGLKHLVIPAASGRRFIWWRQVEELEAEEYDHSEEGESSEDGTVPTTVKAFQFLTSLMEELAPSSQVRKEVFGRRFIFQIASHYDPGSAVMKQLEASKRLEIPRELARADSPVFMFQISEWSGTILVQLESGQLFVLRYGKA